MKTLMRLRFPHMGVEKRSPEREADKNSSKIAPTESRNDQRPIPGGAALSFPLRTERRSGVPTPTPTGTVPATGAKSNRRRNDSGHTESSLYTPQATPVVADKPSRPYGLFSSSSNPTHSSNIQVFSEYKQNLQAGGIQGKLSCSFDAIYH